MYRDPNGYSDYGSGGPPEDIDYFHPDYYWKNTSQESETSRSSLSAQPVQPLDPYVTYPDYPGYGNSPPGVEYDGSEQMREYRSPRSVEGYISDAGAEQREAAAQGHAEGGKKRKGLARLGGIGATIGALLLKFKTALLLLLNVKWLVFFGKFGLAAISAVFSVVVYSLIFGWPFAIGLVALLFIHEMGHALVMKLKGIPVGGLIFIPMLGAAVTMRQMPQNARDEAEVGIAGPIAGAIASSVCLALAESYPHTYTVWAPLAYFGFFINLFNLIPIVPFDGGRVLAAIDRRVWIVGFLGLLAFQIWSWLNGNYSIWLLFFIFMAATQLWSRGGASKTAQAKAYYDVPVSTRIVLSLLYFGLAAVLVLGMSIARSLMMVGGV
jgi:Zn-dependent protease